MEPYISRLKKLDEDFFYNSHIHNVLAFTLYTAFLSEWEGTVTAIVRSFLT